jgi:hypothetical protein
MAPIDRQRQAEDTCTPYVQCVDREGLRSAGHHLHTFVAGNIAEINSLQRLECHLLARKHISFFKYLVEMGWQRGSFPRPPRPRFCPHVRSTLLVTSLFALRSSTMLRWISVNSLSAFCSQSRSDRPRSSSCSSSLASRRQAAQAFWSLAEHPAKPLRRLPTPCCA